MAFSKSQEMGRQAFINQTFGAPCQDTEFMKLLAQHPDKTLEMLEDWTRGWHSENLKAEV